MDSWTWNVLFVHLRSFLECPSGRDNPIVSTVSAFCSKQTIQTYTADSSAHETTRKYEKPSFTSTACKIFNYVVD
jgi:hypothetical protein